MLLDLIHLRRWCIRRNRYLGLDFGLLRKNKWIKEIGRLYAYSLVFIQCLGWPDSPKVRTFEYERLFYFSF